jgi:type IV pilus biogenesis protein CpaD/CtpE
MKKAQAHRGRLPAVATAVAALAVAATLASCSNHDDDNGGAKPPVAETPTPPVATTDAFITYVSQLVATQDETSEPASVDGVAATAPENTEPQPLPAS